MKSNHSIRLMAYEILRKKGKPLHYKEITELIMQKKELKGNTPWKTVNAQLCLSPKFKRIGVGRTGMYGLKEWKDK